MRKIKMVKRRKKQPASGSPGVSELLEQALSQPGVNELMAVYDHWKALDAVARHQFQAIGMKRVILASDSSGPMVRRIT
jgi:hypothetical protein